MTVYVSDLFTATPAAVNASPTSTRTWQWLRGSSAISGATSSTYTAVTADIGSTLSATQLETNFLATTTATSAATEVVQAFDPIRLFSASEPGVWYDPTDMSTLYQNATGTIPVTSFGQPVGLMLDKSRGLVLGPELVTNGDFTDPVTTGWAASGSAVLSVVSGRLRVANGATLTGGATYVFSTVAGRSYKWTYFADAATSGGVVVRARDNTTLAVLQTATITTSGSYSVIFVAQGSTTQIQGVNTNSTIGSYSEFDNISVKELPGLHATQSTEASRPLYGIVPVSGRRNFVIGSEPTKAQLTVSTAGVTDAAAFGTFARSIQFPSGASAEYTYLAGEAEWVSGVTATVSVYVRMDDGLAPVFGSAVTSSVANDFAIVTRGALTAPNTFTITDVGGGIYRVSTTGTTGTNASNSGVTRFATNSGRGFRVTGYTLELGSTATNYQRVGTTYDVTEAGVASVGYLRFDGSTSWMSTPTITPGTDKVQVFAGARVLAPSSSYAAIAETSPIFDGNGGVFTMGNTSLTVVWGSKGGVIAATTPAQTLPANLVLSGLGDIPADIATLRANGAQLGQVTTDQGTGNYLPWPMYIGRRGGTSIAFNGHLFPLIVRFGPNLTAARIAATEAWVATKTAGVVLP